MMTWFGNNEKVKRGRAEIYESGWPCCRFLWIAENLLGWRIWGSTRNRFVHRGKPDATRMKNYRTSGRRFFALCDYISQRRGSGLRVMMFLKTWHKTIRNDVEREQGALCLAWSDYVVNEHRALPILCRKFSTEISITTTCRRLITKQASTRTDIILIRKERNKFKEAHNDDSESCVSNDK